MHLLGPVKRVCPCVLLASCFVRRASCPVSCSCSCCCPRPPWCFDGATRSCVQGPRGLDGRGDPTLSHSHAIPLIIPSHQSKASCTTCQWFPVRPMDYQTFNSQQHLPSSFGGPFSTPSAAHLAQPTTHSPQHQQLYADPQGRLQQSTPSPFPYGQQYTPNGQPGGFAPVGGVAANAMMQPGLSHNQNQLHHARGKPQ